MAVRNVDGVTPLFLAALHGRKQAFLFLHYLSNHPHHHSAILPSLVTIFVITCVAFQIIHLYGNLVNSVNEKGWTPLHLLANKPSVFKSGNRFGRFEALVYYAIIVKKLKAEPEWHQQSPTTDKEKNSYPENYKTCMEFLRLTKIFASVVSKPLTQFLHRKSPQKYQIGTDRDIEASKKNGTNNGMDTKSSGSETSDVSNPYFPVNYRSCVDVLKFVFVIISIIFGTGSANIDKVRRKKEKHVWSAQIMDELLKRASIYEYDNNGSTPKQNLKDKDQQTDPYSFDEGGNVTMAGITEGQQHSTTKGEPKKQNNEDANDEDPLGSGFNLYSCHCTTKKDEKNEKFFLLLKNEKINMKENKMLETPILIAAKNGVTEMVAKIIDLFPVAVHDMDAKKKNIVLLAVENRQTYLYDFLLKKKNLKESIFGKVDNEGNSALHLAAKLGEYKPWLIPGEALQMHWEIKWYLTPRDVFSETHKELVKSGGEWLKKLLNLAPWPEFKAFAISSLIALCCSVTSLVLFLSILTSQYQERDFGKNLPRKLILGLTSLFMSITSMMVCFCAGHFFVLKDKLKSIAFPVYAVTCLPVTLFALAQFPLYIDLIWATFKKVPQRGYKTSLQ
ncbi:hypothetical protein VNO78_03962 [Psophocarpus tetragonolobus]|uniref:PGG domain-containing protein n=1 Tax=Psophocarpus tetragonolobus TaxID=3891 RepID=A0AAN9T4Z7_PSOTE